MTEEYTDFDGNISTTVQLRISSEFMPEIYNDESARMDDFLDNIDDYELYGRSEPFDMGSYIYNTCMEDVHGYVTTTRPSVLDAKFF